MTKEQRIELMNILERLGAETYCSDCLFRNECESRADCIFDNMHDLIEKDGEHDAVQVIRCKDCKYRHESVMYGYVCDKATYPYEDSRNVFDGDWFCADGKQKDGEQDD